MNTPDLPVRVKLRPVILATDEVFLEELYFSTRDDIRGAFRDPEKDRQLMRIQYLAQTAGYKREYPEAGHDLILFDGQPVGRVVVDRSGSKSILVDIAVLPAFRNQGIGSLVIDSLLAECQQKGCSCELSVVSTNPARNLYLRKGFHVVQDVGTHLSMRWDLTQEEALVPQRFDRDKFAQALDSKFVLTAADDATAELILGEVGDLREYSGGQGFSIVFLAPENCAFTQGLYDLRHPELGEMQLFLVPVGLKKGRLQLEAVFNLLTDDES